MQKDHLHDQAGSVHAEIELKKSPVAFCHGLAIIKVLFTVVRQLQHSVGPVLNHLNDSWECLASSESFIHHSNNFYYFTKEFYVGVYISDENYIIK